MATLITPLVSGIAGAGSGTAEFYRRGTTTAVTVYSDPDALFPVGRTVDLDENGGWTGDDGSALYAAESVFVRVRSSLGLVVREFVMVVDDVSVDVQSASFTGLLPSGSQGAGGVVDERTVLDRWVSSGGALDWKIRRAGVNSDETLIQAFSNVAATNAPFFNVRSYGAVGDGIADDYQAFVDARTAAEAFGGGIIFAPAGTYLLSRAFSITSQRISLKGAGAAATIITSTLSAGVAITVNAGASTFSGISVEDLTITNSVSGANATPLQIVSTPGVLLRNVFVKQFGLALDIRDRVVLQNCDVTVPASATAGDYCVKFTSAAADSVVLGGKFTMSHLTNTGGISVAGANIAITGAKVDCSALTPGASYGIDVTAAGCKVQGCTLVTGVAASYGLRVNADVTFYEANNTFSGSGRQCFLASAISTTTQIQRLSRRGRYKSLGSGSSTATLTLDGEYDLHEYTTSSGAGGTLTIAVTAANLNCTGDRMLLKIIDDGGSVSAINGSGAGNREFHPKTHTLALNDRVIYEFVFIGDPNTGKWYQVGAVEVWP